MLSAWCTVGEKALVNFNGRRRTQEWIVNFNEKQISRSAPSHKAVQLIYKGNFTGAVEPKVPRNNMRLPLMLSFSGKYEYSYETGILKLDIVFTTLCRTFVL